MGRQRGDYGRDLMRWVEAEVARQGERSWSGWARARGLETSKLSRWRTGQSDPDLPGLVALATAIQRPLWELLIVAGYIAEGSAYPQPVMHTPPADVRFAIAHDPTLSEAQRAMMLAAADVAGVPESRASRVMSELTRWAE